MSGDGRGGGGGPRQDAVPGDRGRGRPSSPAAPLGPTTVPRDPAGDAAPRGGSQGSAASAKGEWTYRRAGVDLEAAERAVQLIAGEAGRTRRPEVWGGIGAFAGFFRWPPASPVKGLGSEFLLAATCDGVGTKLALALQWDQLEAIGRDLVAMNVNDLAAHGAQPLFFLDYVACGRLEPERVARVVRGMADACGEVGCALLGGETAELPGLLPPGGMELAGFAVGAVEAHRLVDGRGVRPGDVVLGLPSSGPHSNGFALIRRVVEGAGIPWERHQPELGSTLVEAVLQPTRLYSRVVPELQAQVEVRAMAHITGGGIPGNVARTLPEGCRVVLDRQGWPVPAVFRLLQRWGRIADEEMVHVFNLGIGFTVIVPEEQAQAAMDIAQRALGEPPYVIGRVVSGARGVEWR